MKEVCSTGHVFEYPKNGLNYPKSRLSVMPAILDVDTTSYKDVQYFLDQLSLWCDWQHYAITVVFGDEQLVDRIWKLRCANPEDLQWVIPFAGEFHFCLHIVHAIYRLHARLLKEIASFLGRTNIEVDFVSRYFHRQEDFLLLVFKGIHRWFEGIANKPVDVLVAGLLRACEKNKPVHQLLYLYFHMGTFYVHLRQEIRRGQVRDIGAAWLYCWPLFHSTNKTLYTRLSLITAYTLYYAHPVVKEALGQRLANLRGIPGHCIGTDMVTEKV